MKQGEIQNYKNIGTIQMGKDEDGKTCYFYTHSFFNRTQDENTIKGAKEMLDWEEKQAQDIRQAINVLTRHKYKVYKEIA